MKSGLKVITMLCCRVSDSVATYAAMKSGLKVMLRLRIIVRQEVATYAAMKSGLKGYPPSFIPIKVKRSNLCRDEKRTEREGR